MEQNCFIKKNDTNKKYKMVFIDYYFEDINKEIKILNKLGNVDIIDCNDFVSKEIGNQEKNINLSNKNESSRRRCIDC